MKVTTIVDPTCKEEEVIIRVRSRNELSEKMERLAAGETAELMGFLEDKAVILDYVKVHRFTVEKDKIYAHCADNVYWVKRRLYQIGQNAPDCFVKIHQSCLANVHQIARFETAFTGTLRVVFKNGDVDYVSRRNLKQVKERFGL